jgi:tripartite-type tricarboxylate transporter receptor subunit TctC
MPIDYLNGAPLVASNRIVALAVSTKVRYPGLPSTPTLHETVLPDFELLPWMGLFGPPNLPRNIVEQMSNALGKMVLNEMFVRSLEKLGPEPTTCRASRLPLLCGLTCPSGPSTPR